MKTQATPPPPQAKMKLTWKKKNNKRPITNLPFDEPQFHHTSSSHADDYDDDTIQVVADSYQAQGNKLAEVGNYHEALGKWEAAITLMPERAALHEQKAQVLLEIEKLGSPLQQQLAWVTLGRVQLNFGEPDSAIESFDKAFAIKPDSVEAKEDRTTALHLVKKRKQLHSSGLYDSKKRYMVGEKTS